MKYDELTNYYNDLLLLATSKCGNVHDAEDLTSEVLVAAYAYIKRGGEIAYPKTWLTNTLMHKYNDMLRKRYRTPCIVNLDLCAELIDEDTAAESDGECEKLRAEVNYLAGLTREIIIRYYFGRSSVGDIAAALSLPEGTVKRRLFSGREQIRKGFEMNENEKNTIPGKLYLSFGGCDGRNGEPVSLVDGDLIAQNLLMLAYDKPLNISELSRSIGIPSAYIEPIVDRLVDGELMKQTGGGRYYADLLILKPDDYVARFNAQLDFAKSSFEKAWGIIEDMLAEIRKSDFFESLTERQRVKLERYSILKALQDFQHNGTNIDELCFPQRCDGGCWYAHATAIAAGYDETEWRKCNEYMIQGGHRTTATDTHNGGTMLWLYEFDTTLWDSPHRFTACGDLYFKHIHRLLWNIYNNLPLEEDIPNAMIECLPALQNVGILSFENGIWHVDIPVLKSDDYDALSNMIDRAAKRLTEELGNDYAGLLKHCMVDIPSHLNGVPKLFRYIPATAYIVMAIVREAYERGLHLGGVDYCCPPAVLVYRSKK